MKIFDDSKEHRWLFCMTHPDDELSIIAWIKHLTQQQIPAWISWTHSLPKREQEARNIATLIGVPQENLFFLNGPDQNLLNYISTLTPLFKNIMHQVQPTRVVCGAFEQGHLDHDTTNFIVNKVAPCPVFELPFYHTYLTPMPFMNEFAQPQGQERRHLSKEESSFKIHLAKTGYPSQRIWQNLVAHEIRQFIIRKPRTLATIEKMRLQTHFDFLEPNLPPLKKKLIKKSKFWKKWIHTISQFIN